MVNKEILNFLKKEIRPKQELLSWRLIFPIITTITFIVWFTINKTDTPSIWLFIAGFGIGWMYIHSLLEYFLGDYFNGKIKGYEEGFKNAENIYREQIPNLIIAQIEERFKQYPILNRPGIGIIKPRRIES